MGGQKEQHNVDVLVVRWKRLRALPNCRGSEQVLETSSLTFAGKFSQFDPGLVHRQIPMPVRTIPEAVTCGAVGCDAKHFLQQASGLCAECRWGALCGVSTGKVVEHAITSAIGSHSKVFGNFVPECLSFLLH